MAPCARLAAVHRQLAPPPQPTTPTTAPTVGGGALALVSRTLQPSDLMFGGAPIGGVPSEQAEATVHACLRAGIRHYDSAPLYSESEDKLGAALLSASEDTIGAPCSFVNGQLVVDGEPVYVYTKTGRLIRHRIESGDGAEDDDELAWRPAGPAHGPTMAQWPAPGAPRVVTDDFSANGAFLSFAESRQRLGGGLAIDTLRIHDADTVGGPGASQATGALDQALLPQGMLAGDPS
jgi:aryl-alcohol dehydrogenase-like predicted oxidoreductase